MDWLHPTYAWALLALPFAVGLYVWARRRRRRARNQFGDRSLVQRLTSGVRSGRRSLKAGLVVLALGALAVGLMGPRIGTEVRTVERQGVDLIVALDVSASMRAEDVAPSRLARAKNELRSLVDALGGDRVGLVLFAGSGFVQCPLTTDYGAFRLFLDIAEPEQMPVPGTNVEAAVDAAVGAFDAARPPSDAADPSEEPHSRVVLLVSDGENHEGNLEAVRETARDHNVTLFTAGIGTEAGARIPVYEEGQRIGVKRTEDGTPVRTVFDPAALKTLAQGEGAYFRIGRTSSALTDVPTALRRLTPSTIAEERFSDYTELFQWPLAVGLLLLFVEALIPVRARAP